MDINMGELTIEDDNLSSTKITKKNIKDNPFIAASVVVFSLSMLGFGLARVANTLAVEEEVNYYKTQLLNEGDNIELFYYKNDKTLDNIDINNIVSKDNVQSYKDIRWTFNKDNNYLTLIDDGDTKKFSERMNMSFYNILCMAIQTTKQNEPYRLDEPLSEHDILIENKNIDMINGNLGCITDMNNKPVIIYKFK